MNFLVGSKVVAIKMITNRLGENLDAGEEAVIIRRFPFEVSEKATVVDVQPVKLSRFGQRQILADIALPEQCLMEVR